MTQKFWQTARRRLAWGEKTLVMGILNATPDSFSDGNKLTSVDAAVRRAEEMIDEGADLLDIGGESTRPNSQRISEAEEIERVVPVIAEISKRFETPISVDTTKAFVAQAALAAGAEIINDVSGLRFDEKIAEVAAETNAGLVLMHLRGTFETMHQQTPVEHILPEVVSGLRWSAEKASNFGVKSNQMAFDIGIGFSKTFLQNLELLAQLDKICHIFADSPLLVGTSRKSFIGKILGDVAPDKRLHGTMASISVAILNGANIVRVHDVRAAVETAKVVDAIKTGER